MPKIQLFKSFLNKKDFYVMNQSLKSGWLTHGKNNLIFEKKFSKLIKTKYAVSMNSCTSALECALKVVKKKGEVIIPSWTWVSTANVVLNTGLLGRWQIISKKPLVICDIAHNTAALKTVFTQLEMYPQNKKIILGFSKDKDVDEIVSSLNKDYEYHICGSHNSRIINPDLLLNIFIKYGLIAKKHNYAIDAYNYLLKKDNVDNLIIFTGSSFIVSDILKYLDNV